ncbi:MAG: CHAD domain-containing protein [Anaerolineales bacterium]
MQENRESAPESTNFLQEIYKARWQTYRSELKRCQNEATEEAVHDLRVATRRLLALIELLRASLPHPRLQKLRTALKDQLKALNDLRDTQVMLIAVSNILADLPEIAPFQKYLLKRERRLLRSTARAIKSFKYSGLKKQMESVRKKILKRKPENGLERLMLQTADDQFGAVMLRYQRVDPANPASIHRTRVAFKKFRYVVEILQPLIPGLPEGYFKKMHAFQDVMGDIQDVEVLLSTFEDFAKGKTSYEPEPVLRHYQGRHKESVNAFIEDMQRLKTFWRPAPEEPFPWETGELSPKENQSPGAQASF